MKIDEPIWGEAICISCLHEWRVFLPDGCNDSFRLQCPKCSRMFGQLKTDEHIKTWGSIDD